MTVISKSIVSIIEETVLLTCKIYFHCAYEIAIVPAYATGSVARDVLIADHLSKKLEKGCSSLEMQYFSLERLQNMLILYEMF